MRRHGRGFEPRQPDAGTAAAAASTLTAQAEMVHALTRWLRERHPGGDSGLVETHISFVLIAGPRAYKIKKAVDLGFVDFTTLALRRHFCDEELRLNRRTAPELYLDVVPVTGTAQQPCLGGRGPVIDWALTMRAFAQDGLWDRLAAGGRLGPAPIDALALQLTALHDAAAVADPQAPGAAAAVRAPVLDTLDALDTLLGSPPQREALEHLRRWEAGAFAALHHRFDERQREGHVRECHGDLHLGNVTEIDGRTTIFDALEFDPALRWTDTVADTAFMAMDLQRHALPRLAHRFVNACLEHSGDIGGLRVLRYCLVYRALVRAKIAALRQAQREGEGEGGAGPSDVSRYLDVALACCRATLPAPVLMLTHGCSGSGKTALTQSLLELCGALRLRADVERKRLFGMPALARSDASLKPQLYSPAADAATHAKLRDSAAIALASGWSVILDATFLDREPRDRARELAASLGAGFLIIDFQASASTLRERVRRRALRPDDASEADLGVLEQQLARLQPLDADEQSMCLPFDAEPALDEPAMAQRWAPLLRRLRANGG